jgi:TRAP-type C4-dicarboxylate transport system permease small subunit
VLYLGILGFKIFPKVGLRQTSATMGFPMLVPQSAIIIGCFLMTLQLIGVLLKSFIKEEEHNV